MPRLKIGRKGTKPNNVITTPCITNKQTNQFTNRQLVLFALRKSALDRWRAVKTSLPCFRNLTSSCAICKSYYVVSHSKCYEHRKYCLAHKSKPQSLVTCLLSISTGTIRILILPYGNKSVHGISEADAATRCPVRSGPSHLT